jgi:hypothetical protein
MAGIPGLDELFKGRPSTRRNHSLGHRDRPSDLVTVAWDPVSVRGCQEKSPLYAPPPKLYSDRL